MTEETLRRWVRGQLPPAERREVSRWMLRCTDPELPELLQALTREARDEARDADLIAQGRGALVRAWRALGRGDQEVSLRKVHVGEIPRVGGVVLLLGFGPRTPEAVRQLAEALHPGLDLGAPGQ